jgi:hypothetical protein
MKKMIKIYIFGIILLPIGISMGFLSGCGDSNPEFDEAYGFKESAPSLCESGYDWYLNGDKSVKMEHVIYGQNADMFSDSIVNVITFDLDSNPIVLFTDVLHNCYNWNDYMYDLGYSYGETFNLSLFNKNKDRIFLPEYNSQPTLKY